MSYVGRLWAGSMSQNYIGVQKARYPVMNLWISSITVVPQTEEASYAQWREAADDVRSEAVKVPHGEWTMTHRHPKPMAIAAVNIRFRVPLVTSLKSVSYKDFFGKSSGFGIGEMRILSAKVINLYLQSSNNSKPIIVLF
ncbi:hypothetical protein BDQ17DRAFT_1415016 [Cyathus striatus]|nr:hypothetical protein BDQ17DRAFT_1415016 [Cyathus striatus]